MHRYIRRFIAPHGLTLTMFAVLLLSISCAPDEESLTPDNLGVNVTDAGSADTDLPDPGSPDTDSPDPTSPDTDSDGDAGTDCEPACAHGECEGDIEGMAYCRCASNWSGEGCDECARGYVGDDCDECADGFLESAIVPGTCVLDPCAGETCNDHGVCHVGNDPTGGLVWDCRCDNEFQGETCDECREGHEGPECDTCADGYMMEGGICVILACSPIPCEETGTCVDADGDGNAECVCEPGWTGRDCGTCAQDHLLEDGECVLDICANVDCSRGTCGASPSQPDTAFCLCDDHWAGAACDVCEFGYTQVEVRGQAECLNTIPVRDARFKHWFDAMQGGSFRLIHGDQVMMWDDLVTGRDLFGKSWNGSSMNPVYRLLPTPGVVFDGNALLWGADHFRSASDYTVFSVVSFDPVAGDQVVLSTYYRDPLFPGEDPPHGITLESDGATSMTYSHDDGTSPAPDVVTQNGFHGSTGPQLVTISRQPFLNGQSHTVGGLVNETTVQGTNGPVFNTPVDDWYLTLIGQRGHDFDDELHGTIHEMIFYHGVLTSDEKDAIKAYLKVKWRL